MEGRMSERTIPLALFDDEATALAQLVKRIGYDHLGKLSRRSPPYPDGRCEQDVMWAAVQSLQRQLAAAGFDPR